MQPFLSVVIPAFNLGPNLRVTLAALAQQSLDPSAYEVIFIDDASTDATAERLAQWNCRAPVTCLHNDRNLGRSATRNKGWRAAKGDVIVFLDGDMIASPDLLAAYRARFEEGDVDVVSGRRRCLDLTVDAGSAEAKVARILGRPDGAPLFGADPVEDFVALRAASSLGQWPGQVQAQFEREMALVCDRAPTSMTRAFAFVTSNVAVTREALDSTDGFYPFLSRAQDTDMGLQLAVRGARFAYLAEADAIHPFEGFAQDAERYRECFQTLIMRHPYRAVGLVYHLGRVLGGVARLPKEPSLRSLSGIAQAEVDGALGQVDVCGLLEADGYYDVPGAFDITREELTVYLQDVCRLSPVRARREIEAALSAGLLTRPGPGGQLFNFTLTRMWLEDYSTLREHVYRNAFFRTHWRDVAQADAPISPVRWRGEYELRIPNRLLRPVGRPVALNLALPSEMALQRDLAFTSWDPPELAHYLQGDTVLGFPVRAQEGEMTRVSYAFSCEVSEWRDPVSDPDGQDEEPLDRWLGPGYDPPMMLLLYEALQEIDVTDDMPALEAAHRIYAWMLRFRFEPSPMPDSAVLTCGFGHCIQFTRIFVNLCRLCGIPARERTGAYANWRETGADGVEKASRRECFTPFAHSWAEFYAAELGGWLPAEFIPLGHGANGVTPFNFADDMLRERFLEDGPLYNEYFFGRLDPFHIYGSPHAHLLPTLAFEGDDGWVAMDVDLGVRHELTLTWMRD